MDPTMTGRSRADFAVDLLLSDPYFYGPEISANLTTSGTTIVTNPGDIPVWSTINLTLNGELTSPVITNQTAEPDVWMRINTAVVDDPINISVGDFTVINTFDDSNLTGSVTHSGFRAWMKLLPGNNTLKLTSTGVGTGDVDLTFQPAYL
jgi:hypothetical protein